MRETYRPTVRTVALLGFAAALLFPLAGTADTTVDGGADVADGTSGGDTSDAALDVGPDAGTDTGSAGDTVGDGGTDAGDATTDGSADSGGDAGDVSRDADGMGGGDVADADGTADGGDTSDAEVGDTGRDASTDTGLPDAGPRATVAGEVDVQFEADADGVSVVLRRPTTGGRWERTTEASGAFEFPDLPVGDYRIELSLQGYVTIGESFRLEADRDVRYTMYRDQAASLRVEAIFPDADQAPASAAFELEGERGTRESGSISVSDAKASWSVETLPVGNWTITANADDWEELSFDVEARDERSDDSPYHVRLYMRQAGGVPPAAETVCVCRDRSGGGGGGTPRPGGPYSPAPAILLLVGLGVLGLRYGRRRR